MALAVQLARPVLLLEIKRTLAPCLRASIAALNPAAPDPIMRTSVERVFNLNHFFFFEYEFGGVCGTCSNA